MFSPPQKILVTGATGFLGRHVVDALLQQGRKVRLLVRNPKHKVLDQFANQFPSKFAGNESIEVLQGDVLDVPSLEEAFAGMEAVIHTAAVVSFARRNKNHMHRVNVQGTANVVNVALECPSICRMVHVSSVAALGRSFDGQTIDEKSKWTESKFNTDYGRSKFLAEREVFRGQAEGLSAQIISPSLIIGPGNWHAGPPRFFSRVDKGLSYFPVGRNSVVGVWDVARATTLLLDVEDEECRRYILAERSLTYEELFQRISHAMGKKPPPKRVQPGLARFVGRTMEALPFLFGKDPQLTLQSARTSGSSFSYSAERFRERFSFTFEPIEEVIARTASQYKQENRSRDD